MNRRDYESEENLKRKFCRGNIICFNPFQAERDRIKRRDRRTTKKLKQPRVFRNRGYRRYLSMKTDVKIDQKRWLEVKYDGK
ncbi:hypothetical protein [Mesotoga sp.]|uniref:hypothetical protein n=1 Tax=Mesotoga sp. TaxID=2053577 RepID=UPI00345EA53F